MRKKWATMATKLFIVLIIGLAAAVSGGPVAQPLVTKADFPDPGLTGFKNVAEDLQQDIIRQKNELQAKIEEQAKEIFDRAVNDLSGELKPDTKKKIEDTLVKVENELKPKEISPKNVIDEAKKQVVEPKVETKRALMETEDDDDTEHLENLDLDTRSIEDASDGEIEPLDDLGDVEELELDTRSLGDATDSDPEPLEERSEELDKRDLQSTVAETIGKEQEQIKKQIDITNKLLEELAKTPGSLEPAKIPELPKLPTLTNMQPVLTAPTTLFPRGVEDDIENVDELDEIDQHVLQERDFPLGEADEEHLEELDTRSIDDAAQEEPDHLEEHEEHLSPRGVEDDIENVDELDEIDQHMLRERDFPLDEADEELDTLHLDDAAEDEPEVHTEELSKRDLQGTVADAIVKEQKQIDTTNKLIDELAKKPDSIPTSDVPQLPKLSAPPKTLFPRGVDYDIENVDELDDIDQHVLQERDIPLDDTEEQHVELETRNVPKEVEDLDGEEYSVADEEAEEELEQ